MAAVYSTLLGRYNASGTGNFALFTAAAGSVTIIRDITGAATDGSAALNAYLLINGVAYWNTGNVAYQNGYHWEGRIVLDPGDLVSFDVNAGYGSIVVSGYVLDA